jgi:SAM-dependent methyltransferase
MRAISQQFCSEDDPRAHALSARMIEFYAQVDDYHSFQETNQLHEFWKPVVAAIGELVAASGTCRVLEFGAGRTGFAASLGDLRSKVVFDVQDINSQNVDYLRTQSDNLYICDVRGIDHEYDVIFSTFAWEHLTEPRAILQYLLTHLSPRGRIFIACPRYDFPFYLSPSARRLPRIQRLGAALWLMWRRALTLLGGRAAFLLHTDPAIFHGRWFRDADAVHWASLWDLRRALPATWRMKRLRVPAAGLLGRFWERHLLLFVEIRRSRLPGGSD